MNDSNQTSDPAPLPEEVILESDGEVDIALMLRVKEGDIKAFEELVNRFQAPLIGTAAKMLGDPIEAQDIVQQVFVRVWRSAPRYEATAKFSTWLFTILRNLIFNEMRRKKRRSESSLEERDEEYHHGTIDPGAASPDQSALREELENAVDKAIQKLPGKQRLAVILRRYEDMAYEDIAKVLKLTLPAVKSVLFRARVQLKELLKSYLD